MHAALRVEADLLGVPSGLSEQDSALVPEANGSTVKIGVLRVVFQAVLNNEVEVGLELVKVVVALGVDALPHGGEVHWVFDVVQVVRHLREEIKCLPSVRKGEFFTFYRLTALVVRKKMHK